VADKKLSIVYFCRKPRALGNFSVEAYFQLIAEELSCNFDIKVVQMPFESTGIFPRIFNAIYAGFRQGDINHITGDIHYIALFLRKKKTMLTVLDCGMLEQTRGVKRFIFKLFWFILPSLKVQLITAISSATKDDLLRHINFDDRKIHVVFVSVKSLFTKRAPIISNSVTPKKILQIGTAPNKNINRLIEAISGLNVELTIIGYVDDLLLNKLYISGVNHVVKDWKLTDDEILDEYVNCDIVAFVSTLEGFGMPIVEAQKVGRVVVTSNLYSMPEVAGDAAILVDPYNVQSIRYGFLNAIENQDYVHQLILKGYQNATRFDSKAIAKQYADLYNEIHKRYITMDTSNL